MTPAWISAFLDIAPADFDVTVAFWQGVTGYDLSETRGEHDEFATLVPPDGDGFLKVQRLGAGPSGIHLDVHHPDHEFALHNSPGGLAWCSVSHAASVRPRPATWPGGHASLVDQVCLDIPWRRYDAECSWWSELTGWPVAQSRSPEFRYLERPADQPLRLLLQRLEDADGPVGAHGDIATTDRAAETERHVALGARVLDPRAGWTVLADPAGPAYCITDRRPGATWANEVLGAPDRS